MPPRSLNGWVQKLMAEWGMTLGEAETEAARIMIGQPSLFKDSDQRGVPIPPLEDVGSSPQRQRPPAGPGYDPRTSDWEGF